MREDAVMRLSDLGLANLRYEVPPNAAGDATVVQC